MLSEENITIRENLFVLLKQDHYELDRNFDETGMFSSRRTNFTDKQVAHAQFWNRYERPPKEEYQKHIANRRDLLVPQDIRERKGSFFTPQIWVELSQKYLADVLGEDWQDEYYIWDCAAGTGNLLAGLTDKYKIFASTLDKADVAVMHDRIEKGANLLNDHCFQFDFLNDDFSKLPQSLQDIINNPKKRKKLVVYINPPYAEADNRKGEGRAGVAESKAHQKYSELMGYTKRELYIQFLTRIYKEIPSCTIGEFSTLKALQAPRFSDFRNFFKAKLKKCFIVPADTFDNVKGQFPIGFKIWDTDVQSNFKHIKAKVFNSESVSIGNKGIWNYDNQKLINDWVKTFRKSDLESIATIIGVGSDFQNQRLVRFGEPNMKVPADNHNWQITTDNLIESSIYFTVRKIIPATWLNDRDQFLYPNDDWENDLEFQNDCLTYTLFNNNIRASKVEKSETYVNHWIPFTEYQVGASTNFTSNFMTDFMDGKETEFENVVSEMTLFYNCSPSDAGGTYTKKTKPIKRKFSKEAKDVFKAGLALWKHYHKQPKSNVNASLYDIREHFQGRNDKGKMNNKSDDETYNELIANLRETLKTLAEKIEPKVYEYGFLKQ